MNEERREEERVIKSFEVKWEGETGSYTSRIGDISTGGCFIDTLAAVEVGDFISLSIKKPDGKWLTIGGEIVSYYPNIGFGVSFTLLTDDEERQLLRLIDG
ncbi:MAG TPA: PilZ domain-containing protein [Pyrinomonadaceae bacterium]|nr:PilZ domain-containing protein [Pyrinomonadaceae bacterium]